MSDKNIFDEKEVFNPMARPEFDYEKFYPKLMENYCAALSRIEELESRELGHIQSLRVLEDRVRELQGAANKVLNTIMQTKLKSSADLLSDEWIEAIYRLESAMGESPPKAE